jgi:hypothetical protein
LAHSIGEVYQPDPACPAILQRIHWRYFFFTGAVGRFGWIAVEEFRVETRKRFCLAAMILCPRALTAVVMVRGSFSCCHT